MWPCESCRWEQAADLCPTSWLWADVKNTYQLKYCVNDVMMTISLRHLTLFYCAIFQRSMNLIPARLYCTWWLQSLPCRLLFSYSRHPTVFIIFPPHFIYLLSTVSLISTFYIFLHHVPPLSLSINLKPRKSPKLKKPLCSPPWLSYHYFYFGYFTTCYCSYFWAPFLHCVSKNFIVPLIMA